MVGFFYILEIVWNIDIKSIWLIGGFRCIVKKCLDLVISFKFFLMLWS